MPVDHPFCPPVTTLVELLRWRATHQPDQLGYTHLGDGENPTDTRTWAALDRRARAVGAWLQARTQPGDRALLLLDEGNAFLDALFGCLYAGVLAVPVHPPDPRRLDRTLPRLQTIAHDAGVGTVLSTDAIASAARGHLDDDLARAEWLALDRWSDDAAARWTDPGATAQDLAYLQYTSGSTSAPKGVMISHHNLLHQLLDFDTGYDHDRDSVLVSWLPATHDLGLVYGRLMALFIGMHCVHMSPVAFMRRPLRWLLALDRFRGTHSPSPNFGFDVAILKTTADERAGLDLSCVKVLLNGAEPVRQATEERFIAALAPIGLPATAVTHAMGMSEATAKVVTEPIDRAPPRFLHLDAAALEDHRVVPVAPGAPRARAVGSCGRTVLDTRAWIVDPDSREHLGDDRVGELWVGGTTVAQGYWNKPALSESHFRAQTVAGDGPFLRTGDLAFAHQGEIYLTGRLKDLVIVRGQNHHPQDIEWSVTEAIDALRPNCAAAFGVDVDGAEALVVVAEAYPDRAADPEAVFGTMRRVIFEEHGLQPAALVLLRPRTLPKTSSGKIQRSAARRRYLDGSLDLIVRWDAPSHHEAAPAPASDLRQKLERTAGRARHRVLLQFMQRRAAHLLGLDPEDVEPDRPLSELGLDSVTAVELVESVGRALDREVDGTALFDHPTLEALSEWLLDTERSDSDHHEVRQMSEEEAAAALLSELDDL